MTFKGNYVKGQGHLTTAIEILRTRYIS